MTVCASNAAKTFGIDEKKAEEIVSRFKNKSIDEYDSIAEDIIIRDKFRNDQLDLAQSIQRLRELEHQALIDLLPEGTLSINEFRRVLHGNSDLKWGAQNSYAVHMESQVTQQEARILNRANLNYKMVTRLANDKTLNDDFVKEWFAPGTSEVKEIRDFVEALREERLHNINTVNANGGTIVGTSEMDPVTMFEFHDPAKLAALGEEGWINFVEGLQNSKFARDRVQLKAIYRRLTDPNTNFSSTWDVSGGGGLSYAKSRGSKATNRLGNDAFASIHFKDADAWVAYNNQLGHQRPVVAALLSLQRQTRLAALVERMGPDPERTLRSMMVKAKTRDGQKFTPEHEREVGMTFDQLIGNPYETALPRVEAIVTGIKNIHFVSKLGFSPLTAFNDIAMSAFNLNYMGMGVLESYSRILSEVISGQTQAAARAVYRYLQAGTDGILSSGLQRWQLGDVKPGLLSGTANSFAHYIGLNHVTNRVRMAFAKIYSMHIADMTRHSWDKLPNGLRLTLERAEISAKDWDIIRQKGVSHISELMPDKVHGQTIERIPDEKYVLPDWVGRSGGAREKRISQKLASMYYNEVRIAVPEAGLAEKSAMRLGFRAGSPVAMALDLLLQFRTPLIRQYMNMVPRVLEMGPGFLLHTLPWVGIGYASMTAKDFFRGRTPRDPTDPQTGLDALAQTGFLIYGSDILAKVHEDGVKNLDEAFFGPTYQQAKSFSNVVGSWWSGEEWGKNAYQFIKNNTPMANVWYGEALTTAIIHDNVNETFSPGYLDRKNAWLASKGQQPIMDILTQ